jgi:hypothetical protein
MAFWPQLATELLLEILTQVHDVDDGAGAGIAAAHVRPGVGSQDCADDAGSGRSSNGQWMLCLRMLLNSVQRRPLLLQVRVINMAYVQRLPHTNRASCLHAVVLLHRS